jgi:WD40 repeat protein
VDCDDVMLALANRARTLTAEEGAGFHAHLETCEECRAVAEDATTEWRWVARLPQDAFEGTGDLALPMVDPIVFDIDMELAQGGMGRITKATDRRLGRDVAVKEVLETGLRARFEREAMITARLQHPAIVPIYEAGTFPNGNPFYTMRLVWGGTLGAAIHKTRSMTERLALLPHVLAVIDALAYAHDNRIIHRDLKPGNVLVGEFGETVVIDWGLAKELDSTIDTAVDDGPSRPSKARLTRVGSVLGTPGFMSPEQASGGTIDERADVYALGAILYNLLAGVPPYWDKHASEGSTQLIAIGLARPPTPIVELAPDAPADLRMICEKAMARRKEDRYPSAKEMAAELRRFSAGQLISREYTLRELVARWVKKHRTAVTIGSIAAVALAVVAVLAFVNVSNARTIEQQMRVKAEAAEATAKQAARVAEDGNAELLEEQALRELLAGDSNRAITYVAGAFERGRDTPALRYLFAAAADDLENRHYSLGAAKAIGFDGAHVVTIEPARIAVWNEETNLRSHPLGTEPIESAHFDRRAKHVAIRRTVHGKANAKTSRLEVWEVASGTRVLAHDGTALVFDRDGTRAASYAGATAQVHELASRRLVRTGTAPSDVRDLARGPTHVAACTSDGIVWVWELGGAGEPQAMRPPAPEGGCVKLAFLDGQQLVIANKKYEMLRWRIGQPKHDRTMSGHMAINTIAVSDAKDMLRIAAGDATGVVMWSWDGQALGESRDVTGGTDKLAFSPDGRALIGAGADDRVFVWDTDSFHMRLAASSGQGSIRGVAIVDDRIAAVGEKSAYVWAMPKGRIVERKPSTLSTLIAEAWVTITAGEIALWDPIDAKPRLRIPHASEPHRLYAGDGLVVLEGATSRAALDLRAPRPELVPVSPDARLATNRRLLLAFAGTRASISETATGREIAAIELGGEPIAGDLSADGKLLAIVFGTSAAIFDLATKARRSTIALADGRGYVPHFSPTGAQLVLVKGPEPALLVEVATGRTIAALAPTRSADGVAFSRDGSRIAIGIANTVQLWTAAGEYLFTVGATIKDAYALSDDGQLFATGSIDGSIRIWDARDSRARMLDRLVASQTGISRLEFFGDRLIGQSDDGHATMWDVHRDGRTRDQIRELAARHSNWRLDKMQIVPKR